MFKPRELVGARRKEYPEQVHTQPYPAQKKTENTEQNPQCRKPQRGFSVVPQQPDQKGERLYQQRLGAGSSGFSSSPVMAGDHLYVTNEEGHTYVLAPGREYKLLAQNEVGETVMATPAIADGVLYIRARKHLFAVGAKK